MHSTHCPLFSLRYIDYEYTVSKRYTSIDQMVTNDKIKKKVVEIDVMIKSIFCDENIPYIRFFIACHKICQNGKIYVAFSISVSHFFAILSVVQKMILDIISAYLIFCD